MQTSLRDKTLELVNNYQGTLIELGHRTGVKPKWLWDFKNGVHRKPDVCIVETLYVFLSGKKLEL